LDDFLEAFSNFENSFDPSDIKQLFFDITQQRGKTMTQSMFEAWVTQVIFCIVTR
jgi:hypothetical protein